MSYEAPSLPKAEIVWAHCSECGRKGWAVIKDNAYGQCAACRSRLFKAPEKDDTTTVLPWGEEKI